MTNFYYLDRDKQQSRLISCAASSLYSNQTRLASSVRLLFGFMPVASSEAGKMHLIAETLTGLSMLEVVYQRS